MPTKIFVGNLAFSTDSAALRALFAPHGEVTSAQVVQDRDTGRSRGFGFVEMTSADEAQKAIAATNGKSIDGRQLTVNLARARTT
jgi:cold-inducible RNA-binding protein